MSDIGDLIDFHSLPSADERALRDSVRTFVKGELGKMGLLGMHLKGCGCAGRSAVEYGLAGAELEAGDSGLRTFVSVQGSLGDERHLRARFG